MAKKKNENANVETPEIVKGEQTPNENEEVTSPKETTSAKKEEKKKTIGVVTNCVKLNVRNKPEDKAKILTEVPVLSELEIEKEKSTDKWYKVTTASGISGFCMKQFVSVER